MKKINKLNLSPEKVMKTEELINMKGGYGGINGFCCLCTHQHGFMGGYANDNPIACMDACWEAFESDFFYDPTCL